MEHNNNKKKIEFNRRKVERVEYYQNNRELQKEETRFIERHKDGAYGGRSQKLREESVESDIW